MVKSQSTPLFRAVEYKRLVFENVKVGEEKVSLCHLSNESLK
jgi:hypothetical protein